MPRYLVQRTFRGGLALSADLAGARACALVVERNAELGVTWLQSYISNDLETPFCVYDGPGPEAVRHAAARNGLPVDRVT